MEIEVQGWETQFDLGPLKCMVGDFVLGEFAQIERSPALHYCFLFISISPSLTISLQLDLIFAGFFIVFCYRLS